MKTLLYPFSSLWGKVFPFDKDLRLPIIGIKLISVGKKEKERRGHTPNVTQNVKGLVTQT